MSRWLARGGVAVALVAALALGRWIEQAWPSGEMDVRSYERTGGVGDRLSLRYADLRVEGVTASTSLATGSEVAATTGTWLVVDATLWANRTAFGGGYWRVVDREGRVFDVDQRAGFLVQDATPKVPWHLRVAFGLPKGDLAGTTLRLSADEVDERRDDVAVIDLGIDAAQAARLDTLTDLVPVKQGSSFAQPPLPGQPGYDDVFKDAT
jgi:hypothetical protein